MNKPASVTFPCGCFVSAVVTGGRRELHFSPCRADCPVIQLALAEANEQGKAVEWREA